MTEPQVWVLIALFAGMLATISTLFVRVVRSEIGGLRAALSAELGGLRAEMRAELGGLRAEMNARFEAVDARFEAVDARFETVDVRFDHLDRDVAALSKRVFGADQP